MSSGRSQQEAKRETADSLHNRNCHRYLTYLITSCGENFSFDEFPSVGAIKNRNAYDSLILYGEIYTNFMRELREKQKNLDRSDETLVTQVLKYAYLNDAKALEHTNTVIKKNAGEGHPQPEHKKEHQITAQLQSTIRSLNSITPLTTGGIWSRLATILKLKDFMLQDTTGIPQVKNYNYLPELKERKTIELRLSTQAQYVDQDARIDPLFEGFLKGQFHDAKDAKDDKGITPQITHVYFNCLRYTPADSSLSIERNFESVLSRKLHDLGATHSNLAVISLPSDDAIMSKKNVLKTRKNLLVNDVCLELIMDVTQNRNDFYISNIIKEKIKDFDQSVAIKLKESFIALGITKDREFMSESERQAVYFHFLKYKLPRYLLETLQPKTFNFTCKDGIDRGGIASLYFNLVSSMETEHPLSMEEFQRGLHAAPTMVKGRGMNDNVKILWNVIDRNTMLKNHASFQSWLSAWLNLNRPKQSRWEKLKTAWNNQSTKKKAMLILSACLFVAAALTGWGLILGGLTWAAAGSVFAGIGTAVAASSSPFAIGAALTVGATAVVLTGVGYSLSEKPGELEKEEEQEPKRSEQRQVEGNKGLKQLTEGDFLTDHASVDKMGNIQFPESQPSYGFWINPSKDNIRPATDNKNSHDQIQKNNSLK